MRSKRKTKNLGIKRAWKWSKVVVFAFILAWVIRYFIFTPIIVEGISMFPTLNSGDRLFANKISYQVDGANRFDIIVFHVPNEPDFIKRVIGLPGDHIAFRDDMLFVNGVPYDEPYLYEMKSSFTDGFFTLDFELEEITGEEVVPEGHYFVLGDNRRRSNDSRMIGFIPSEDVVGKVSVLFWPLSELRIF